MTACKYDNKKQDGEGQLHVRNVFCPLFSSLCTVTCLSSPGVRSLQVHINSFSTRVLRLSPRLKLISPSSVLLRGVWWLDTDVSGLRISSIIRGQAVEDGRRIQSYDEFLWQRRTQKFKYQHISVLLTELFKINYPSLRFIG